MIVNKISVLKLFLSVCIYNIFLLNSYIMAYDLSTDVEMKKDLYMINEPKWLEVYFYNKETTEIDFDVRVESITITDNTKFRKQKHLHLGSYLYQPIILRPEEKYLKRILLDEFILISKPGTYDITIKCILNTKPYKEFLIPSKITIIKDSKDKIEDLINEYTDLLKTNLKPNYIVARNLSVMRTPSAKKTIMDFLKKKRKEEYTLFKNFVWINKEKKDFHDNLAEVLPYLHDVPFNNGMIYLSQSQNRKYLPLIKSYLNSEDDNKRLAAIREVVKFEGVDVMEMINKAEKKRYLVFTYYLLSQQAKNKTLIKRQVATLATLAA